MQTRRDFIQDFVIASGALFLGGYYLFDKTKDSLANKLHREFPSDIPGARKVEKLPNLKGAKKCLVHIRQAHKGIGISDDEKEYVINVQKDIYSILSHLNLHHGVSEVYNEGNFVRDDEFDIFLAFHPGVKQLTEIRKDLEGEERFLEGAEVVLANEGKISLNPGETIQKHYDAMRERNYENIFVGRENTALGLISLSANPLDILIYGGLHYFGDNIYQWNKDNPDQRFTLIEVTPKSYVSDEQV